MQAVDRSLVPCVMAIALSVGCGEGAGPVPVNLSIDPSDTTLWIGQQAQFHANLLDGEGVALDDNGELQWSTDDPSVATVDSVGLLRAVAAGVVKLEATVAASTAAASITVAPLQFKTVYAASGHTCGTTPTGVGFCWGDNVAGQLGDGTTQLRSKPTAIRTSTRFREIGGGGIYTCGLGADSLPYCWGFAVVSEPDSVPVVVASQRFSSLVTGGWHVCGIATTELTYCWGSNDYGALGNGTTAPSSEPVEVLGGHKFVSLAAGGGHTCGLLADGLAYCWGNNVLGQLGDGTTTDRLIPTATAGGLTFAHVATGTAHSCGLMVSGEVYCWGGNPHGALGDGTTEDRTLPTLVFGVLQFEALDLGQLHSCGITATGSAYCWGDNLASQLGVPVTLRESSVPVAVSGEFSFETITVGNNHACGIGTDGIVRCWGSNVWGQLGNGTTGINPVPVAVANQQ